MISGTRSRLVKTPFKPPSTTPESSPSAIESHGSR